MDVQYGQASVLTPSDLAFARDGIAAESDPNEETVLICDVDLEELSKAQSGGTVTPRLDRRADLFKVVTTIPFDDRRSELVEGNGPLGEQPELSS
jgi:hypothetical protein